jgi:energy-coupling factor transporter ATP-binding protein EcfA2
MAMKADDADHISQEQRDRLLYMREEWTLMYGVYEAWYETMLDFVTIDEPGQLVLLIGTTHVGKTTLMKFLERVLAKKAVAAGLPVYGSSYIRIPAASGSKFDKGETYRRLIQALQPNLPQKNIAYGDPRDGAIKRADLGRVTHAGMLQAVVNRMRDGYYALFLDEVGELPLLLKTNAMMEAAMSLKEIADLAQRTAFLAGGPEVAPLLWQNAQLSARLQPIWMHPLRVRVKDERAQFIGFLASMAQELGRDYVKSDVIDVAKGRYIMEQTWGTIGLASKEMVRAVAKSLRRTGKPLDWITLKAGVDLCHEKLKNEMPFEIKMLEAARDPDKRTAYWAMAGKLNMRSTLEGRIAERNRRPKAIDKGTAIKGDSEKGSRISNVKKGTARPNVPERTPMEGAIEEVDS